MRKRLLAVLLTAAMLMSLCMPVLAVEPEDSGDEQTAEPVLVCAQEEHAHSEENGCYTVSEEPQCGQEETEGHAHTDECYEAVESWACGLEETEGHTHGEDCYGEVKTLTCTETESDGHQHDDGCYETASEPSCGMAEGEGAHTHGDDCYSEETSLSCGSEEEGHEHDDGCYITESALTCGEQESEGHVHGDDCYESTLTCEIPVGDGAHHHGEDCYEVNEDLICEQEEAEAHTHSDACGVTSVRGELLCELEEAAGHAHSEDCYLTLTCEKAEHEHTDACYEQTAAGGAGAAQCTCGASEGETHAGDCPMYVVPECTCGAAEGEPHAKECPLYVAPECTCGTETLFHDAECPLYVEPITAEIYTEEDGVYTSIAHGEKARLDVTKYDGQTLYVVAGDAPQNLYFMREAFGGLVGADFELSSNDYAMLTSDDGVIADTHAVVTLAGSIPAGTVLTLTANKIISGSYVVNIVVLEELPEEDMDPLVLIQQVVDLEDGSRLEASFGEGAFGDDASVELAASSIKLDENEIAEIQSALDSLDMEDVNIAEVLHFYGLDINFDGEQPLSGARVSLTLSLPSEETPDGANMIFIVHLHEDGAEILGHSYISAENDEQILSFGTDSFSHYAAVYVNGKYNAQKLEDVLVDGSRFEIQNFNVNLFDYDPIGFNEYVNSQITPITDDDGATTAGNFLFKGKSYGNTVDDGSESSGVNDTSASYVKQGILQPKLSDTGLPEMKYVADGKENAELFFGTEDLIYGGTTVKTVYEDIDFQFVHDTETGDYIYKSAANHAQYNESTETVELYADNLAVVNNKILSLGLGGYYTNVSGGDNYDSENYYKDVTDLKFENSVLSGTAEDTDTSFGVDPRITYGNLNLDASKISKIYVKLKASGTGEEKFQIFYHEAMMSGPYFQEDYSFAVSYTANEGGYIEIVLDTSLNKDGLAESSNWSGTIEALRIDPRNSSGTFEIAEISFLGEPDDNVNSTQNGGFYPFTDIADSFPGQKGAFDKDDWKNFVVDGEELYQTGSRAIANASSIETTDHNHLAFGMTMEVDFYLPIGTNESDGQDDDTDFVYEFTGDDDLWIFIDGYLVLDMGGAHGAIKGSINFTNGKVEVANAAQVTGYGSVDSNVSYVETDLADCVTDQSGKVLNSPGKHTMKIFYLERGASVSNCYMRFNLPLTPQGALTVTKEVEHGTYDPNQTYTFTITGVNGTEGSPMNGNLVNLPYYVIGGDSSTALTTNAYGQFTLKAGQSAVFGEIDEGTTVKVTESLPSGTEYYIYVGTIISISGGSTGAETGSSDAQTTDSEKLWASDLVSNDSSVAFTFTNYYTDFFGKIIITKKIQDETKPDQSFLFRLKSDHLYCEDDKPVDMTVILSKDQFKEGEALITIEHLPAGVYSVTEDESWSWRYDLTSTESLPPDTAAAGTVDLKAPSNDTGKYIFTNARDDGKWLDGESWCRNIFDATTPPCAEGDVINKQKSDDEG